VHAPDEVVDEALRWARAAEPRGFECLFRIFGPSVAGYLRMHHVGDPDGTANEVFVRAFRSLHTFRGDASRFRAWLFTIAHHASVDDARRRRRRIRELPLETISEPVDGQAEDAALHVLARERVRHLLDGLSADQRDVLVLRIVADLSVAETAAALGKSYEAVKALQRRGLAALAAAVSSQEAVPG
jgi:RNA polymerase sigma-70 factor (ECF subfamily)